MNGYFRPLRRKVGVATLALACVFVAAWVRSRNTDDFYGLTLSRGSHLFIRSINQKLEWTIKRINPEKHGQVKYFLGWHSRSFEQCSPNEERALDDSELQWKAFGIELNTGNYQIASYDSQRELEILPINYRSVKIRYWSLIVPLMVVSAFLLLSKSRRKRFTTQSTDDATSHQNAQDAI